MNSDIFSKEYHAMNFEAFQNDIIENNWNVFGVEVYEKGRLTHSFGDTTGHLYDIYSATKSVVSIAVGILYDQGLIELEKSILEYLPEDKVDGLSSEQRQSFEKVTVERLLTMSVAGFPFRPEGDNYLDFCLSCKLENPKERVFHYNNINVYLVSVALTEILGYDLGEFIEKNIFQPLGITQYEYGRSPEGYFYGASKLKLTVHDLGKIGLVMYHGGVYEGKRIVSEKYVRLAISLQQMNREGGYGYYFWKYRDGFSINGKWMQRCYCLPKQDVMITYLANIQENSKDLLHSMEKNLLG